ncbi:ParA family protein [Azospirillum sp. Sh1]|uniref:ParA family protein n=1 Tax=Azospirillum sp. Sh1 TaxID=2607285 RepID=UPI0011ECAD4E|nr:ParA family protein [Azospirillum sp. Sh1]KAA0571123.1 ParA family protein [Azospirillum sp. Sh1]
MNIITVLGPKGGGGKSTCARNIAAAAAQSGLSVTALDTDPQGTLARWGVTRKANADLPVVTVQHIAIATAPEALRKLASDLVIVDTPTAIEEHPEAFKALVLASSLVLIPARPSLDDVVSVAPFAQVVHDLKRDAVFILNAVKPRVAETDGARRHLSAYADVLSAALPDSVDIQRAMAQGEGITERGGRGADIANALWAELRRRLRLSGGQS